MQEYIAHRPHLQGPLKVALRAAVAAVWVQAAVMAVGMQVAAAAAGVQAAVSAVRVPAGLNAVVCSGGWQPAGPDAVTRQLHWLLLCLPALRYMLARAEPSALPLLGRPCWLSPFAQCAACT